MSKPINRRLALSGLGGMAALGSFLPGRELLSQAAGKRRFVFIICADGGANINDAFLVQTEGVAAYSNAIGIEGSPFRAAPVLSNSIKGAIPLGNGYAQETFLKKYAADTLVMGTEVSSVNHLVAAKRALTGDNANSGRTLPEAVASAYGEGLPLANLMLAGSGYAQHGDDTTVRDRDRAQLVSDPLMFAFATHGFKGISPLAGENELRAARAVRKQLEQTSRFARNYDGSKLLGSYIENRESIVSLLEKGDTVSKLMLLDPATNDLSKFGFSVSADFNLLREKFPNMGSDPFEARLALGFLAAKNGLANAITASPGFTPLIGSSGSPNTPIAFDWSHVDHRGAQNTMWSYILKSVDALIDLLKSTDVEGDPSKGKMWDQSLIYIATEFGRDKVSSGGSGHHLNNGVVMISPLLKGNQILGGIDPKTGLTFGFDPKTGTADPKRLMREKDVYGVIAQALGISYSQRLDYASAVRTS